jgi:hypothetical protein
VEAGLWKGAKAVQAEVQWSAGGSG